MLVALFSLYHPAAAYVSNTDAGGYVYTDTVTFAGSSISGTGSPVSFTNIGATHLYSGKVALGFAFNYYGAAYESIYVMSDGWASFVAGVAIQLDSKPFPNADACAGVIAPCALTYWGPDVTGDFLYETQGEAPHRRFVVEWSDVLHRFVTQSRYSFQLVLCEGSNQILFNYDYLDFQGYTSDPESCNIGIESPDQTTGLDYGRFMEYNDAGLPTDQTSLLFGRTFVVFNPYQDTLVADSASTYRIEWAKILRSSGGRVYLYYDDGMDTTGTLIDSVSADGNNYYDWTPGFSTQVYLYGKMRVDAQWTTSYAPGRISFGRPFVVVAPHIDTSADSSYRIVWTDFVQDSNAMVYLYYDDGTDYTGTLIDSVAVAGHNYYDWTPVDFVAGTQVYVYGRMKDGAEWTDDYAPGRITFDHPVPVCLASFAAQAGGAGVMLNWSTTSEHNNLGWNVYRAIAADNSFVKLNSALIPGVGTTAQPQQYQFVDMAAPQGTLTYKLEQVDVNGTAVWAGQVTARNNATGIRDSHAPAVVNAAAAQKLGILRTMDGKALTGAVQSGVYVIEQGGMWRKIVVVE
jgi:hypothetical protein